MDDGPSPDAVFVRLLGRPEVRWADGNDDLLAGMPKRMLAYLAARGGDVGRDEVAALLWPRHELERRRGNLRRLLGRAKELPYAASLEANRERLRWPVATDLALVDAGDGTLAERAALLAATFLDGVEGDDDDAFSEWLLQERDRLRTERRRLLLAHAAERRAAHDALGATLTYERLLEADPLDEEALQRLLEVAAAGDAAIRARSAYRRFVDHLQRELGLAPLDTTRALASALGGDAAAVSAHASGAVPAPVGANPPDGRGAATPTAPRAAPMDLDGTLVGRSRTLDRLHQGSAGLFVVTGEPGVGKTAVVRAASRDHPSLWLRAEAATSGRPFAAVEAALRDRLMVVTAQAFDALDQRDRAVLAQLVPSLAPGGRAARAVVEPAEGRGRLVAAAARALRILLGADGWLIVDDLHLLDAASVDVVTLLVRDAGQPANGMRLIATARSSELATAPGRGALERLDADGLLERLPLAPWTEHELHSVLTQLSGHSGGRLFARRLHAATGGNALFVLETLRHLFAVGLLHAEPDGGWSTPFDDVTEDYAELPLPPTLHDAVRERVDRLDAGTRRLLEAAALAVPPFSLERVAPATALSSWLALEALERAVDAGLLVASGDGYRFGHDLVRRAIADGLGPERRSLIERRLAWALERERAAPGLIAAHFERAGRRGDAYRWHRRAAAEASALYVPSVAIEHLERAATLAEHESERVSTYLEWLELLDRTVDPRARQEVLSKALTAADRLGDPALRARVAIARVRFLLDVGEVAEAETVGEDARSLAHDAGLAAEMHLVLARAHLRRGDADGAIRELDAGVPWLPEEPSELRGRYLLEGYVSCAHLRGDLHGAFTHVEAALAQFDAIGHRELQAEALNFQGIFLAFDGRPDEGIERLEQGLEIAREVGHVAVQRRALLNLVKLHTDRADAEAAAPLVAEGLALAHDFEQRTTEVAFLLSDGYVRYLRGDLAGAVRAFERAIGVADADANPMWRVHARLVAATPRIHAADHLGAAALLDAAEDVLEAHSLEYLRPRLAARRAALAVACDDHPAALAIVERWHEEAAVPAEERGEFHAVRAAALWRSGDHAGAFEAAAACRGAPTLEVIVAGEALALEAALSLGHDAGAALAAAQARLDDGRAPPFELLALMRAVARASERAGDAASAVALRTQADERAARLRAALPSAATDAA